MDTLFAVAYRAGGPAVDTHADSGGPAGAGSVIGGSGRRPLREPAAPCKAVSVTDCDLVKLERESL